MRLFRFVSVLFVSSLCTAAFAEATTASAMVDQMHQPGGLFDATPHVRTPEVSGQIALYDGIGIAGRFTYPLVADGFIPELNDSFEVGLGAEFYLYSFGWGYNCWAYGSGCFGPRLDVLGEVRWTFHIYPNFAAYAKLSLGPTIPFGGGFALEFTGGPGVIYKLNDHMSVSGEAVSGYPYGGGGVRGGIDLVF